MQRFEFLRQPLMGELAMSRKKEREREKKMPFVVATYVYASSQGQRTHSARTNSVENQFAWTLVLFAGRQNSKVSLTATTGANTNQNDRAICPSIPACSPLLDAAALQPPSPPPPNSACPLRLELGAGAELSH